MNIINRIPLQEWFDNNIPEEEIPFKKSMEKQILFVRDYLHLAFKLDDSNEYKKFRENITVIGSHRSKSIDLPVYLIEWRDIFFIMRDNFYDWKISVNSGHELNHLDELNVFIKSADINSIYCGGFEKEWVYGSYQKNKKQFTVEVRDYLNLFCLMKLISYNEYICPKGD